MIVTVTGRVINETGAALPNLTVEARGDWLLTTEKLKETTTGSDGRFTLEVAGVNGAPDVPSSFRLRVLDITKRPLTRDRELSGTVPSHDLGDIMVQRDDLNGLRVTNLSGVPLFVTSGNALKLLVDGEEAFGRIARDIGTAEESISMTQLFFAVPDKFNHDNEAIDPATKKPKEKAKLVFEFSAPPLTPIDPHQPNEPKDPVPRVGDRRPERLILDQALTHRDVAVRILLWEVRLGWPEGVFWLGVLTALAVGLGVGGVGALAAFVGIGIPFFPIILGLTIAAWIAEAIAMPHVLKDRTDVDEVVAYFAAAIADAGSPQLKIAIRGFRQSAPDNGVLHCKMVIVDGKRAVVVGSPFEQRYFDVPAHKTDDARRGDTTADVVHDLSIAVVGPAVHDLHESLRLFWNEDLDINSSEKIGDIPFPPEETQGEDALATVQIIRTLSSGRFTQLDKQSEKGILEAYLRAFAAAEKYIYLETQYFTDSVITDALVEVLKKKPNLELILLVPIKPDVIFYPRRQAWRIQQLRAAGGNRVGVFTRWSYDEKHSRPWVTPVYIHAKGAVVDDSWATVGSANLDGLSLDYNLLLSPLVFGETTAAELNVSVLPPAAGAVSPFAELMRRRLFAEHLGLVDSAGNPDPNHDKLGPGRPARWLDLWRPMAKDALDHVKAAKPEPLHGFVLEYPEKDGGWLDTPRKHLAALGVHLKPFTESRVRPITGTRKFDFSTGKWDKLPEREDIKQ